MHEQLSRLRNGSPVRRRSLRKKLNLVWLNLDTIIAEAMELNTSEIFK